MVRCQWRFRLHGLGIEKLFFRLDSRGGLKWAIMGTEAAFSLESLLLGIVQSYDSGVSKWDRNSRGI
jgi:hypothetical protein